MMKRSCVLELDPKTDPSQGWCSPRPIHSRPALALVLSVTKTQSFGFSNIRPPSRVSTILIHEWILSCESFADLTPEGSRVIVFTKKSEDMQKRFELGPVDFLSNRQVVIKFRLKRVVDDSRSDEGRSIRTLRYWGNMMRSNGRQVSSWRLVVSLRLEHRTEVGY